MHDRDNGTSPIQVKRYSSELKNDLLQFLEDIKNYKLFNWSFERLKTHKITYHMAYYNGKVIAINGCYQWEEDKWMMFTRQITNPKYFRLIKRVSHWAATSIPGRFLSIPSMDYCLANGAKELYFCIHQTNYGKDAMSWKTGQFPLRHAQKMEDEGVAEYHGMYIINSVPQDLYKINIYNMRNFLNTLNTYPLRLNYEID